MDIKSSKLLDDAVEQLSSLPGIGKRTALRLALHLLRQSPDEVKQFGEALIRMRSEINYCSQCHNISDTEVCGICSNRNRDHSIVCVVEDIRDVMAIENTQQYNGVYHVLGGVISPMDGIGPGDLHIDSLLQRVEQQMIREIIMALSSTMEGDTTNFFLYKKLKDQDIAISTIARGMAIGDQIEYTDELTLGRSIQNRLPYEKTLQR